MHFTNLADMFYSKKQLYPDHIAYRYKSKGGWIAVNFKKAVETAELMSGGFASLGIEKGDRIAIVSGNRMEWALADYAALFLGAILVPVYPSLMAHQIAYILNDAQAKLVIVEDGTQVSKIEKIRSQLDTVENIFVIEEFDNRKDETWPLLSCLERAGSTFLENHRDYIPGHIKAVRREDVATIIYTSGTTGEPKGVVLSHKNFFANLESVSDLFDCYPEDEFLSFLPLSHILERTAGHYFSCYHGATVCYAESIDSLPENLIEIKPTLMISVPRLFEKMYGRILESVESGSPLKRRIFY